jgi:hypothetical protein
MEKCGTVSEAVVRQYARRDWISACVFHDMTEQEVLREVCRRVSDVRSGAGGKAGPRALVLLDLDSTLYQVEPRTFRILSDWAESEEGKLFPTVCSALKSLRWQQVGYSIRDAFDALPLESDSEEVRAAFGAVKGFWSKRFFSNDYIHHDIPYPGAAAFSREVFALGGEIVYLTGRDESGMGKGTRLNLARDGFPVDSERTHFLLKPSTEITDIDHKKKAADFIRQSGTLVASFENEPPNLVALHDLFPAAMHVFMDTVCSDKGAMPRKGLYRIRSFKE